MTNTITLYDYGPSGNCYKVRLLFSLLRIQHLRVDIDVRKGETRTENFLNNVSSNGRVPVILIPPDYVHKLANPTTRSTEVSPSSTPIESKNEAVIGTQSTILTESNAILTFFSDGTPLFPSNPIERAKIMQWLFWEQFSHEPNFASLRFWITLLNKGDDPQYLDQIVEHQKKGYEALHVMEQHLSNEDWFVANKYTIADIALYAYTHCAEEAGYSIDSFPKIKAWLRRVENMPGHVPIDD
ncbi:3883_t:CDS:2 [Funneliformis geosporum]|uniref:4984_t:CDS:1 n=1 Tax=Funneliformis geosporum TaxID=1117311 RepID=A0A9W4WXI6_9GLOM|nr:4984_t:CDS:2 [Funneliformis geosporum]CAI2187524.1 3883_t:CDS:2 [Funneliformis geosporum]